MNRFGPKDGVWPEQVLSRPWSFARIAFEEARLRVPFEPVVVLESAPGRPPLAAWYEEPPLPGTPPPRLSLGRAEYFRVRGSTSERGATAAGLAKPPDDILQKITSNDEESATRPSAGETWFQVKLVDHATGDPLDAVTLELSAGRSDRPGTRTTRHTTDDKGVVRVEGLRKKTPVELSVVGLSKASGRVPSTHKGEA